jgi:hypothetical protein
VIGTSGVASRLRQKLLAVGPFHIAHKSAYFFAAFVIIFSYHNDGPKQFIQPIFIYLAKLHNWPIWSSDPSAINEARCARRPLVTPRRNVQTTV